MQVKELKKDGLSRELEITIPANDIDKRVDTKLEEVGKTARLPGFRPGKVPLAMLKKRYGKAIMGEVLEAAVNETSAKALQDKKLKPAMQPKIEVKSFDDGEDLVYTVNVEILPDFKVADLKGMKLTKLVTKPEDKEVDDALEKIASNNKPLQDVTTKRAAKEGDVAVIDFDGRTADDDKHHDGMKAEGHQLRLGSGQFIPGFEEQLIGKKAGDEVEVKVSFPENYGAQELAGREAIFDVKIHGLKEQGEAKIDDEFAKSLGLDDVKALKAAVKEQLQKELDQHSRMVLKKELLDTLDDANKFEIPAGMLDMEFDNIIVQVEQDRKNRGDDEKLSDAEKKEYKDIAERRVRLGLILSEIGNSNNIKVADPELQKAVIMEAQKYPGQEKEVFEYYSNNPQALESLRAPLFEEKVVDYILELAEVKEKEVDQETLLNALEDDEDEKPKKKTAAKKSSAKKGDDKKPAAKKAPAKKDASKSKSKKAS